MQCDTTMVTSIYIPFMDNTTTSDYITKCFHEKNVGKVDHVDFVINKQKHRREAFVHFSEWYNTDDAVKLKGDLEVNQVTGKQCRFVHNGSQYWPILLNKKPLEKNSPERKSNSVYELEERLLNIEKSMEQLSFMTKMHDANIRYILLRTTENTTNSDENPMKRLRTTSSAASVMQ